MCVLSLIHQAAEAVIETRCGQRPKFQRLELVRAAAPLKILIALQSTGDQRQAIPDLGLGGRGRGQPPGQTHPSRCGGQPHVLCFSLGALSVPSEKWLLPGVACLAFPSIPNTPTGRLQESPCPSSPQEVGPQLGDCLACSRTPKVQEYMPPSTLQEALRVTEGVLGAGPPQAVVWRLRYPPEIPALTLLLAPVCAGSGPVPPCPGPSVAGVQRSVAQRR